MEHGNNKLEHLRLESNLEENGNRVKQEVIKYFTVTETDS